MAGPVELTAADHARHPLTSKKGWAAFVAEAVAQPVLCRLRPCRS
jgi:hypothetical protein